MPYFSPFVRREDYLSSITNVGRTLGVRMDCLVQPIRLGNGLRIASLQALFVLPITAVVFDWTARLRASHPSLRTPDALYVATAPHHWCGEFWMNDFQLAKRDVGLTSLSF